MSTARENQVIIYLEADQRETLAQLAQKLRTSRSAVLRRALDELAERIFLPDVATTSLVRPEDAEQIAA